MNSLIEIAAKGSTLKMQMIRFHLHLFLLHTTVHILLFFQPNPCLTNTTVSQVNLTNTADNREEKSLRHVAKITKFLDDNQAIKSLESLFALI